LLPFHYSFQGIAMQPIISSARHWLVAFLLAIATTFVSAPAAAQTCVTVPPYLIQYTFNMPTYPVGAIAKFTANTGCGSGISNSDYAPQGESTLVDVFAKNTPLDRILLLGVATDLEGDEPGQEHAVLFVNNNWAAAAQGIAWGTLFPSTLEGGIIAALNSLAAGTGSDDDYSLLFDFAENAALFGPNGDAAFALGDSFTAIAFSNGQTIGTGTSSIIPLGVVPEPATWAMMILGFGLTGGALRSRKARVRVGYATA
jgi:hypothetical protein